MGVNAIRVKKMINNGIYRNLLKLAGKGGGDLHHIPFAAPPPARPLARRPAAPPQVVARFSAACNGGIVADVRRG